MAANKLEDSEKSFQQAVTMQPKFTVALQGVALTRAYRGDWKGAAVASNTRLTTSTVRDDKVDATIDLAWFAAASGKTADAYALLAGLDKDPENAQAPAYAAAALDRGKLLQFDGKYDDAAKAFAEGVKRTEKLPGLAKVNAERTNAIGLLRNAALAGKPAADADKLVAVTEQGATTPLAKSFNSWAKGLAAWAKTGAKDAVVELAKCDRTAVGCRYDLAAAQAKAGDAAAAAATTKEISETFIRDAGAVYIHPLLTKKK